VSLPVNLPDWPALMRRDVAAAYLGISEASFVRLTEAGEIPQGLAIFRAIPLPDGADRKRDELRWAREQLDAFVRRLLSSASEFDAILERANASSRASAAPAAGRRARASRRTPAPPPSDAA